MSARRHVAIAHVSMGRGGSEAQAMWAIQALKDDYRVTLLTAGRVRPADIEELNDFYGTTVAHADFHVLEAPLPPGMRMSQSCAALRGGLFQRFCRRMAPQFDMLVSVYNMCDFGIPAVHFVADFCWDPELRQRYDPMPREAQRLIHRDGPLRRVYLALSRALQRPSGRDLFGGEDMIVTNSQWTARLIAERYGVCDAPVIYPPVVAKFPAVPWEQKELGFVCIGRIEHEKRVETMIEIIGRVRRRGHDVHLHVIGPMGDSPYAKLIRRLCQQHSSWVVAEGTKTGEEKSRLLTGHRFGIHARRGEAFGISVAEMVKAGCIPFVPDDGGPPEIVDEPDLCFGTVEEAVAKIDAVLRDDVRQGRLAAALASRAGRFSTRRYMDDFRQAVEAFASWRSMQHSI